MTGRVPQTKDNSFIAFKSIFTADECAEIIDFVRTSKSFGDGKVWNEQTGTYVVNFDKRRVQTSYHSRGESTTWIFDRMDKFFHEAAAHFAIDIKSESEEDIKIMRYEPDDHFTVWHRDTGDDYSRFRKISISILLCEKSSYEGGTFEIASDEEEGRILRFNIPKGGGVAFPSNKLHRVAPVTSGTRWSLVNWIN